MSETTYQITETQQSTLDQNPQFHPISFLDDGDLVVAEDAGAIDSNAEHPILSLWSTWILTRDGKVQGLAYHYGTYHDWQNEHPGRPTTQPPTPPAPPFPTIIDTTQASQYLLLKYCVDVTPRTVRNWLRDGKLAGNILGDHDRSPWYTTRDAIDQAARRDWFPAPEPLPETLEADVHEADLARDAALAHYLADPGDSIPDPEEDYQEWLEDQEAEFNDEDPAAPRDWAILTTADVGDDDDTEQEASDGLPEN